MTRTESGTKARSLATLPNMYASSTDICSHSSEKVASQVVRPKLLFFRMTRSEILVISVVLSLVAFTRTVCEQFICADQSQNSSQSNEPVLTEWYGIPSHLACGILCQNSPYSCTAFHFTYTNGCYLYGAAAPPVLPENTRFCQRVTISTNIVNNTETSSQKSATASSISNTVTIQGVNYPNLSCYPVKLFSSSSYSTKIPIAGRQADCKCAGGLYLEDGAYVNQTANTFATCFAACEKIPSPPCEAFAFMEVNNSCVIAPYGTNGVSTDKGVLQCYT